MSLTFYVMVTLAQGPASAISKDFHIPTLDNQFLNVTQISKEDARICKFLRYDLELLLYLSHQFILTTDWIIVKKKVFPQIMFHVRKEILCTV